MLFLTSLPFAFLVSHEADYHLPFVKFYLFVWGEREEQGSGRERERERENPKQGLSYHCGAQCRAQSYDHKIMT